MSKKPRFDPLAVDFDTAWTPAEIRAELQRRRMEQGRAEYGQSIEEVRARCAGSLMEFVRAAWPIVEPGKQYVHSWHLDLIAEHLEAITRGELTRLLVNIPPGAMKSLMISCFWPAWEWGPKGLAHFRYIATSFALDAVTRDSRRMRDIVTSDWFRAHWPEVELIRFGEMSYENTMKGWREAAAFGSLTSKRADRLIIDDPHSVKTAESAADRKKAGFLFREAAINRLNNQMESAIVVVMQRLHEDDVSGVILDNNMGFTHLCLPMEYEPERKCETPWGEDIRTEDKELLAPDRFPPSAVAELKNSMTAYSWAGQYQQRPMPRGGGMFPYNSWEFWDKELAVKYGKNEDQFPDMELVIGSVDTAFTEKKENDLSAMVVLGVWRDLEGYPQLMLMYFWQERLAFHALAEKIVETGRKLKIDKLLIEDKASGRSVLQELMRVTREEDFTIHARNPGAQDKWARAASVSGFHREEKEDGTVRPGMVYVPMKTQPTGEVWPRHWAESLMAQCASFPKGRHDDGVDAYVQGLIYLRSVGLVRRRQEEAIDEMDRLTEPAQVEPLYPG